MGLIPIFSKIPTFLNFIQKKKKKEQKNSEKFLFIKKIKDTKILSFNIRFFVLFFQKPTSSPPKKENLFRASFLPKNLKTKLFLNILFFFADILKCNNLNLIPFKKKVFLLFCQYPNLSPQPHLQGRISVCSSYTHLLIELIAIKNF